jgi:large subunit ribosomal protein L17
VVQKLFDEVAPKFADRTGGYTRIIKTSTYRIGDGGNWAYLQLVSEDATPTGTARRSQGLRRKRNERRHQFASRVLKAGGKKAEAGGGATATAEAPAEGEQSA